MAVRSKPPAYTIGKADRKPRRVQTPSPADYVPKVIARTSPAHSIGAGPRGLELPAANTLPGPGSYGPRPENSSPHFSMRNRPTAHTPSSPMQRHGGHPFNTTIALETNRRLALGRGENGLVGREYEEKRDMYGQKYSLSRSGRSGRKQEGVLHPRLPVSQLRIPPPSP